MLTLYKGRLSWNGYRNACPPDIYDLALRPTPNNLRRLYSLGYLPQGELETCLTILGSVTPSEEGDETMSKSSTKKAAKSESTPRVTLFEQSVTAVLRFMGLNDWVFDDARLALNTLGASEISDTTIRIQLRAGKKGERGEPAKLTKSQIASLKKAAK